MKLFWECVAFAVGVGLMLLVGWVTASRDTPCRVKVPGEIVHMACPLD